MGNPHLICHCRPPKPTVILILTKQTVLANPNFNSTKKLAVAEPCNADEILSSASYKTAQKLSQATAGCDFNFL